MGRKKELVPHLERSFAFICENPFEFGRSGNWLDYTPRGRFVETVNDQFAPPLVAGWQVSVRAVVGKDISADEFAAIERIAKHYVEERVARQVNPIEWTETIRRIQSLARASRLLLDKLNDQREGYNLIWKRLEQISGIGGLQPLTHDEVYPIVSRLHAAASTAVIQAGWDRKKGTLPHHEPWKVLVTHLAKFWRTAGGTVTAPKSGRSGYAKASPFVQFVWTVVTSAVPQPLREYTSSRGAMQAAISKIISTRNEKKVGIISKKKHLNKSRHR